MQAGPDVFKIAVNLPPEFLERMMAAIDDSMDPLYPGYDHTFNYWPVKGTWRPLEGSDPYIGTVGKIEVADEVRLEFAVREKDLKSVLRAIRDAHPYEEPAIDVIPMYAWKELLTSSD